MAIAVQEIYDEWNQDEQGIDMEYGGGGICDRISQAISDTIVSNIENVDIISGGHDGDDHAFVIAFDQNEAYLVDVPSSTYETGGGYSWEKIPDIIFTENDIVIGPVERSDIGFEEKLRSALGIKEDNRASRGQTAKGTTQSATGSALGPYKGSVGSKKKKQSPSVPKTSKSELI